MNFSIRYRTEYRYSGVVSDNLNSLRLRPASTGRQRVDSFSMRIEPEVRVHNHTDYFGTAVAEFAVTGPHEVLAIEVSSRVSTDPLPDFAPAGWESLATKSYGESGGEFLDRRGEPADDPRFERLCSLARAGSPLQSAMLVAELVPDEFEYRPGVTYVGSTVGDLLAGGAGVCQDFVHLSLAILRRHGVAARYVSGYLFAAGEQEDESVEIDTHAWLEVLVPDADSSTGPRWVGIDPTNRGLAGEGHVKIGHGRFYSDVPPIKGVYRGSADAELDVSVSMIREGDDDPAAAARR